MKAIICDDDRIILKGLCSVIDWQELGIDLVGTAADGREGLKLLQEYQPQLLMTDIRMPYIDGLALIEAGKKNNPNLMAIVFSGYDDFEYARKALKLGVQDYLSKPIDIEELARLAAKCVREYKLSRENAYNEKEDFLRKLIMDEVIAGEEFSRDEDCYCMVMIIEAIDEPQLLEGVFALLKKQGAYILARRDQRLEVAVLSVTGLSGRLQSSYLLKSIRDLFREKEKKVTCAVSPIRQNIKEIRRCYQEAQEAYKQKYIKGDDQDLFYESGKEPLAAENVTKLLDIDLLSPIKSGNQDLLAERFLLLESRFDGMGQDSYLYMQFIVSNLYSSIIRELGQQGVFIDHLFSNPVDEYRRLLDCQTMKGALTVLKGNLLRICAYIQSQNLKSYSPPIYKALQYVHGNFQSFQLSAEETAKQAGLSTGRFSTLFKQETGLTFTDYLLKLRMEMAKELMENPALKIYEVALEAGYENIPYFSTAFKRYIGVSPSEYRAMLAEKNQN